ncbi:MAG: MBL fold metallo-hydrolase [Cyclobacteriaceae bacterium]
MNRQTPITTMFLCLALSATAQQNMDTVKIRPQKLTDQVYMLKGAGGNIGLLRGKDGLILVDDQFAPLSDRIREAAKTIDPTAIRFLINTHIHGDHTGGNENFKRQGITILAHDAVRDRMKTEQVNKAMNQTTPPRDPDAWPVVTFGSKMSIHLNDEDIDLIHIASGHTDGDIVVHFRNANVLHTGDAFVRYGFPFIDVSSGGSVNGFITSLDGILALINDQTRVIPGHGEVATKADVKLFRDRITRIRDEVAAALKKGMKVEDIAGLGITKDLDADWGKGFVKGKDFVLMVAENLRGEQK